MMGLNYCITDRLQILRKRIDEESGYVKEMKLRQMIKIKGEK